MQNTKKLFGISALAVIAICCALMFSIFANAEVVSKADQKEANDTFTLSVKAYTDDLDLADSEFTVDGTKYQSELDLTDIPSDSFYEYKNNVLSIYETEQSEIPIKTITFRTTDKTVYRERVDLFVKQADGTFKPLPTDKIANAKDLELRSACESLELETSDFQFKACSIKEMGNISRYGCKYEEWVYDPDIEGYKWEELTCNKDWMYELRSNALATNEITVNASNKTISWKEYKLNMENGQKYTHERIVRFSMWFEGLEVLEFKAQNMDTKAIVNKLTANTEVVTNLSLAQFTIDGINYSAICTDGIKENIYNQLNYIISKMEDSTKKQILIALQSQVFAIPSTLVCVAGIDGNAPENLNIPAVITTEKLGTVTVNGILPEALNSEKVKTLTLPSTMQVVFEDAATGLTNLESITFNNGSLLYLPDYRADYGVTGREWSNIEKLVKFGQSAVAINKIFNKSKTLEEAIIAINEYLQENMPPKYNTWDKYISDFMPEVNEIIWDKAAFPFTMLASQHIASAGTETIVPVFANDSNIWSIVEKIFPSQLAETLNLNLDNSKNELAEYLSISMKGTFNRINDVECYGKKESLMFGTGSIATVLLDAETGNPISGAKVDFVDEFGVSHTVYSDVRGYVKVDGLYQTGALLNLGDDVIKLAPRSISVSADGYKEVKVSEKDIEERLPLYCYTYTNRSGQQTSDVISNTPAYMDPLYDDVETGYLSNATNMNYVIDISAASTLSGANAQCYELNQTGAQQFSVVKLPENYNGEDVYAIVNVNSNKVLDVSGGIAENYRNVQQYEWNNTPAQKWTIEKDGEFVVYHSTINPEYVIDLNAGTPVNGQNIQLFQANGTAAQKFLMLHKTPAVPGGDFDLLDGVYEIHTAVNNNNVLDVQWGSGDDCANVWAYTYAKGDTNQQWRVTNLGFGYYSIINVHTGKALDVAGCGIVPGTNVWQYASNPENKAQIWSIQKSDNGTYRLVNAGTELVLDIAGASTASEANVQGYMSNGTNAQNFNFVRVSN